MIKEGIELCKAQRTPDSSQTGHPPHLMQAKKLLRSSVLRVEQADLELDALDDALPDVPAFAPGAASDAAPAQASACVACGLHLACAVPATAPPAPAACLRTTWAALRCAVLLCRDALTCASSIAWRRCAFPRRPCCSFPNGRAAMMWQAAELLAS
jgi:hypothetical protein